MPPLMSWDRRTARKTASMSPTSAGTCTMTALFTIWMAAERTSWAGSFGCPDSTDITTKAGTPSASGDVAQATHTALADRDFQQMLIEGGLEPDFDSTPEKSRRALEGDVAHWTSVINANGVTNSDITDNPTSRISESGQGVESATLAALTSDRIGVGVTWRCIPSRTSVRRMGASASVGCSPAHLIPFPMIR